MKRRYDVFVSYRSSAIAWVRRHVLPRLERHGLSCFLDVAEPGPRHPTSVLLRTAQRRSRWTLAVLTPDYTSSPFTDFELRRARWDRRLVAVLAAPCALPHGLATADVADWSTAPRRRRSEAAVVQRIAAAPPPRRTSAVDARNAGLGRLEQRVRRDWQRFESALARRDVERAFRVLRDDLFIPLHYRCGSYLDGAHLLRMLLRALRRDRGTAAQPVHGPTMRPVTGTAILFADAAERECMAAWTLTALGVTYRALWQASRAARCFERAHRLYRRQRIAAGALVTAIDLADVAWERGDVAGACRLLRGVARRSARLGLRNVTAIAQQDLGLRLAYLADWRASGRAFAAAMRLARGDAHRQSIVLAHRVRREILRLRWLGAAPVLDRRARAAALRTAAASLASLRALRRQVLGNALDRHAVRTRWLHGAVESLRGGRSARHTLTTALAECRDLGLAELEADVLLDLARHGSTHLREAVELAREALDVATRSRRGLQRIEALVLLASAAFSGGDMAVARRAAATAHGLLRGGRNRGVRHEVARRELAALQRRLVE